MSKKKILLIGWDAADWRMIDPLLTAGEMPNLQRLLARGVRGNLATIYPALSPMLWTSIATGKRPYHHGVHGFTEPLPDGSGVRPITNLNRRTKALWNILSQNDLRSMVVGWWPSHPAEPIDGVMVSNHFQQHRGTPGQAGQMAPGTVHPSELAETLGEFRVNPMEIEGEIIRLFIPEYNRVNQDQDKRVHVLGKMIAETMSIHAAAMHLLPQEPWDFAAIYYDSIDHFSHAFMKYHPPRLDWIKEEDFDIYQHVVTNAYRYHDLMLGGLLQQVDQDTTVILMSDHGFHPDHKRPDYIPAEPAGPAVEHGHFGILAMSGPEILTDSTVFGASVLDLCPTILALLGLPVGKDMDGKVLANAFKTPPPVQTVDSWDRIPGDAGMHPPEKQLDSTASAEAFEQLVELGYVDPPPENIKESVDETVRELKYNLARAYADGNRYREAIELTEELWDRWPREHRFGILLVEHLGTVGEVKRRAKAIETLQERIQHYRREAQVELDQLQAELEKENQTAENLPPRKRVVMNRLRELTFPRTIMLEWMMASQTMLEGRSEAAIKRIQEIATLPNVPADIQQKVANALALIGEPQEAEIALKQVLAQDPDNYSALTNLAKVTFKSKRYEDAIEAAVGSLSLIYFQPALHTLLGNALMKTGQYQEAEQTLQVALAQHAYQPLAHELLTELYRNHLGRTDLAADHESLALSLRFLQQTQQLSPGGVPVESVDPVESIAAPTESLDDVLPLDGQAPPAFGDTVDPSERITIVSGLPRSGTSMMMQLLAAGGLEPLTDDQRTPDAGNPLGYYEYRPARELKKNHQWLPQARGKAVKIVAQLLNDLPPGEHYQVIFMRRNLDEVVASQASLLATMERPGSSLSAEKLKQTYTSQLRRVRQQLSKRSDVRVLVIDYQEILESPAPLIARIAEMLEHPFDQAAASAAVLPELQKHKFV